MKRLPIKPMRLLRRAARMVLLCLCVLGVVLVWNLSRFRSRQLTVAPARELSLPEQAIVNRLAAAVTIPTISHRTPARFDHEAFRRFADFLQESFPAVHQHLDRFTGDDFGDPENHSLLLRWQGTAPATQPGILLMAHYDVVPAPDVRTHDPFAGVVDQEYIWGRGTLDVKNGVMAILEAIEYLLGEGFQPRHTVYVSLGHDEEVGGIHGNRQIAQWMRRQGMRLRYVLDEGGCIFNDFPGFDAPVALVGVAEKGYLTVRVEVRLAEGGHSSMPPADTAVSLLAEALVRLRQNPLPARLDGGADGMLRYIGPEMPLHRRLVVANRWLFAPLLLRQLAASPSGNAAVRTTFAPTIIEGGTQENVLPTQAHATVNIRILPGDTIESVLAHLQHTIDDPRIAIVPLAGSRQPSRVSSTASDAFRTLHTTIKQVFPGTVVAPYVVLGGTDAAHFDDPSLSRDVYRFIPTPMNAADLKRIHGIDERIGRRDYVNLVRFYIRLLQNDA